MLSTFLRYFLQACLAVADVSTPCRQLQGDGADEFVLIGAASAEVDFKVDLKR